jgi:hypothetical protein
MKKAVTEDDEEYAIVEMTEDDWRAIRFALYAHHSRLTKLLGAVDAHIEEQYDE